jgi:hypothetical protein
VLKALRTHALSTLAVFAWSLPAQQPAPCPSPITTAAEDSSTLKSEATPVLIVDRDNKSSAVLRLRNISGAALPLQLSITDFRSLNSGQYLGTGIGPANLSAADTASAAFWGASPKPLPADQAIALKLDATNLWEAGESQAQLRQNTQVVATIKAVKYRVPLALKLATPPTDKEDAIFSPGMPGSISVRNDDLMTYRIHWAVLLAGRPIEGPEECLPPGITSLALTFPRDAFGWAGSGTIQDDIESARLQVRLAAGTGSPGGLAAAEIPVKLRLRWFPSPWQQLWNTFWIAIVLAAGAAISIALNVGIPNQMKRNAMWKALREITLKINSLDSVVGPVVLTSLRVERSRLGDRLQSLLWFSPNLAAELPLLQQAADLLNARLAVVNQVAQALVDLRAASVPPRQLDRVVAQAKSVLDNATRPDLSSVDLANLTVSVAGLQQQIASLGQTDLAFEADLFKAEAALKARIDAARAPGEGGGLGPLNPASEWAPFLPELAGLFDAVSGAQPAIQVSQYFERDMTAQYASLCARYLDARALIGDPARGRQLDAEIASKLKPLFEHRAYPNLEKARVLVVSAEQGTLDRQLIDAITASPPKVSVRAMPSRPAQFESVSLEAHFHDPALDVAAARERITCDWVFGASRQQGWRVSHYFAQAGKLDIHVEFLDADHNPIQADGKTVELPVTLTVGKRHRPGHIGLALVRTGLALLVALLALIGGVQDKIAALSLVPALLAILILGLTADSIKNSLVSSN